MVVDVESVNQGRSLLNRDRLGVLALPCPGMAAFPLRDEGLQRSLVLEHTVALVRVQVYGQGLCFRSSQPNTDFGDPIQT